MLWISLDELSQKIIVHLDKKDFSIILTNLFRNRWRWIRGIQRVDQTNF